MHITPLYVPAARIAACLPDVDGRVELAEHTLLTTGHGRSRHGSAVVSPRPGAVASAGITHVLTGDVLAMHTTCTHPSNPANGIPLVNGEIILRDAATGRLRAVLPAPELADSALAATLGVAIRRWAPTAWMRIAVLGGGTFAQEAIDVATTLNPYATVVIYDRDRARAETVAGATYIADSVEQAVLGAEIIVSCSPFGQALDEGLRPRMLPAQCLLIVCDGDAVVRSTTARRADLVVTDDLDAFNAQRKRGALEKWPKAHAMGTRLRRDDSPDVVVAMLLGHPALQAAFAQTAHAAARDTGAGVELPA